MDFSSWNAFWESLRAAVDGVLGIPIKVIAIVVVAILVRLALQFVIRRIVNRVVLGVKRRHRIEDTQALQASPLAAIRVVQRTRALGGVLSSVVTTVVIVVALVLVISAIDPGATGAFALITAALGAGLGFGAQNVVKDVLNGLFMVAEDHFGVGDIVDLGHAAGIVEGVGIRTTQVRDVNGTLWYVRNGEVMRVGNLSQGWARVVLDLTVPHTIDVDEVQARVLETALAVREEPKWKRFIIENPEIWGIASVTVDGVVVRLIVKTRPAARDDVARELRARVKRALDDLGVTLPAMHTSMLSGTEGITSVRGAHPPSTAPLVVPARGRAGGRKVQK